MLDPPSVLLLFRQASARLNNSPYDVHVQRDVPEMLQFLLDEMVISSANAMKRISVRLL